MVILERIENKESQQTELVIDGGWLPMRSLSISTPDRNFRREVSVQVPAPDSPGGWRTLQRGTFHRFKVADFHDERIEVKFAEARSDRFRLIIANADSPPLSIANVHGSWGRYELLFLPESSDRFLVFLGSTDDDMKKPRFDTAAIVAAKAETIPRETLDLGPLEANPAFAAETVVQPKFLESKLALWGVIALVVAILIWILYRTLKQVEAVEEEN